MTQSVPTQITAAAGRFISSVEQYAPLDAFSEPLAAWVGSLTKDRRIKNLLSGSWMGHPLHPALTDVPIGAWMAATFFDFTTGKRSRGAARKLVGLGVLAAVPTAMAGASDWADTYGPTQRVGLVHAAGNVTATVLQAASWLARATGNHRKGVRLSLLALGCAVGSAYLGGHLTLSRGIGVSHTAFQEPAEDWSDVAAEADLAEVTPTRVVAGDVPVMLVKQRGHIYALSAVCTHAGGPLDEGELVEHDCIKCPWHGSEFSLVDGSIQRGPAAVPQPVWRVKVEDGRVLVRPAA